jgi:ferredoxin-NADP reductase
MATSIRPKLTWRTATVTHTTTETPEARTIVFDIPQWNQHDAGQHLDLRLTAPDGYQATRSYSLSSGPTEDPQITVERVDGGEVSTFLVETVEAGDTLEIRGPVGGYFIWTSRPEPLLLIGGGSGIAPLRSMWRANTANAPETILYSARTRDRVIYQDELAVRDAATVRIHLTREEQDGYETGRIGIAALNAAITASSPPNTYVCGPTSFVESITQDLAPIHPDSTMIRTERFG